MTKVFRLSNGITVISEERPQAGKVLMQVHIKSGSINEPAQENGLTFLMQESCNGGTTTRSRDQIAESVESVGAGINTGSGRSSTDFGASSLPRHAEEIFTIMADMVRHPAFDAGEIKKTKAQIAQWISREGQSPAAKAGMKFIEAAFSGQTIALQPMGSKERLASFTQKQVRQKHAELLAHPENIIISFAGAITAAQAEKLAQQYFGDLPAAPAAVKTPQIAFTGGDIREAADNEQLNIAFGFKAPPRNDADKLAVVLLNDVLSGGMSGPLFQEIRKKRGLVYSVRSDYAALETDGFFNITAGAGKGNAGELIAVAMDVLGKIIKDGVDQQAMDQARERIIRGIEGASETVGGAASRNISGIASAGRIARIEEIEAQLKQVTSDDLRRVCADMLRDGKYALAAIGPQDTMPSEQEIKAMMQKQLQGVDIPQASPAKLSIKPQFSAAAKAPVKDVAPKITILKNGMKVVTVERPGNMSCGAWVGVGSDNETPALNGASHMFEHMPFRGTPSYGQGKIAEIIEGELGGALNAYTNKDQTAYYFYNLKPDAIEKVVDICGEMVFNANVNQAEFNGKTVKNSDGSASKVKGERDVVIEELKRANDNASTPKWDMLFATAYPDQPHGRPIIGTEETLRAMTVKQLKAYHDLCYAPNNVVFCVAGPVKHEDFVALVDKKFGQMPARDFPALPVPVYKGGTVSAEYKNAKLCDVTLVAEAVASPSPENAAYEVLGSILAGGTSSPLYKSVVVKQGLSAGVSAGILDYRNAGFFCMGASLEPEKIKLFINSAYTELRALADNLTQKDLDKIKAAMEMDMLLESNREICDIYATKTMAEGRLVTLSEISAQVQKLTVDDIKRVAKKILTSNPTLAMVVPPGTDPKYLPRHEEVIAMRDGKKPPHHRRGDRPNMSM